MLNILQSYDRCQAKPTALFTKVQDNKLSLVNECLTPLEIDVLGGFIKWAKDHREFMVLYLEIKNCRFTDE